MANLGLKNNNAGNLKDPQTGQFKVFKSPDEGYQALIKDLKIKQSGQSQHIKQGESIQDLANVWAPASDNNKPTDWANNVAKYLGVPTAHAFDKIPTEKLAEGIKVAEGTTQLPSSNISLAQKVKAKYPQYKDIPDEELTQKVLTKYPQYNDMLSGSSSADSQGYITKTAVQQDAEKPIDKAEPEGLMGKLRGRMEYAGQGLTDAATGKINPLSGISHLAGALGGAVGDVSNSALNTATFGLSGKAEDFIGRQVGKLANTGVGQSVIGTAQGFAEAHPELAADLGDVGNVITALSILKGAKIAKNAVGRTISKTLGRDALSGVMADVAPAVSAKGVAQEAGKGGLMQTLISGRVKTVASKEARDIAEEVVKAVPNFEKLGTYTAKLNATREAVYSLADDLKSQIIQSGKNIIYPFKELKAAFDVLKNDRDLISVFSDKTMANAYDRFTKAAMEISKENGGTISSLFDARKGFDDLVRRAYPNLYKSSQLTPMRIAVRKIRGTMNNFIEKKLPKGSGYSESLRRQSRLFDAIENMSTKAAREVGTTRFSRFAKRHPLMTGLIKGAAKSAAIGATGGAGYELTNRILGE